MLLKMLFEFSITASKFFFTNITFTQNFFMLIRLCSFTFRYCFVFCCVLGVERVTFRMH